MRVAWSGRVQLSLAALAVAFAAADTYVVVLALPDMMTGVGLGQDELQRAAPIVSGFLLGYVAVLPLIGRLADVTGRRRVLIASLAVFAFGSLLTASAYDLGWLVAGRFLQGVGGGGLVPATLALVADLWPPGRRGLPLGIVGGVQELGSVLGPLLGAAVLSVADWRWIFWLNLIVGVALAIALALAKDPTTQQPTPSPARRRRLLLGLGAVVATALLALALRPPQVLATSVSWGIPFVPVTGDSPLLTPIFAAVVVLGVALLATFVITERRPLARIVSLVDLPGVTLLTVCLGGIVLAFATADPERSLMPSYGPALLVVAAVAAVAAMVWQRRAAAPIVPRGLLRPAPAWGAIVASVLVGAGLVAALVDIPVYARVAAGLDQFGAALVLIRFLIGVPVGAVLGGWALRRLPAGPVAAAGLLTSAAGFVLMARWGTDTLTTSATTATIALAVCGLGFGLAIAPINDAILGATPHPQHGLASSLVVVARMIGMLAGISALTALGLRSYYRVAEALPPPDQLCPNRPEAACAPYLTGLREAGLAQVDTIFTTAAVACAAAAVLCALTLRSGTRPANGRTVEYDE